MVKVLDMQSKDHWIKSYDVLLIFPSFLYAVLLTHSFLIYVIVSYIIIIFFLNKLHWITEFR